MFLFVDDDDAVLISSKRLVAKAITLASWVYKYRVHQPYVYPRNDLGYAANFLTMMFSVPAADYQADPVIARALDLLPVGQPSDLADLYSGLVTDGQMIGFEVTQRFYEIGSPAGLAEADRYLRGRSLIEVSGSD